VKQVLDNFVVLEGLDGAGTTTQLKKIDEALGSTPHWATAEPTDGPIGLLIRQALSGRVSLQPESLAQLYAADRNEHLYRPGGIIERLARGEIVVSDRYVFSSIAYQGITCGDALPRALNDDFPLPRWLIYFDVEGSRAAERLKSRESLDIFEGDAFREALLARYPEVISSFEGMGVSIARIDANAPPDRVFSMIRAFLPFLS
jgi:dTMP kinase